MTVSFQSLHSDREIVSRCWRAKRGREIDTSFLPSTGYQNFRSMNSESNESNEIRKNWRPIFPLNYICVSRCYIYKGSLLKLTGSSLNFLQLNIGK